MAEIVERVFKLTPPDGAPFLAAVVKGPEGLRVVSCRDGKWAPESVIGVADLVLPEQHLLDWDVEEIAPDDQRVAALRSDGK
jgi:hypothetical protein